MVRGRSVLFQWWTLDKLGVAWNPGCLEHLGWLPGCCHASGPVHREKEQDVKGRSKTVFWPCADGREAMRRDLRAGTSSGAEKPKAWLTEFPSFAVGLSCMKSPQLRQGQGSPQSHPFLWQSWLMGASYFQGKEGFLFEEGFSVSQAVALALLWCFKKLICPFINKAVLLQAKASWS